MIDLPAYLLGNIYPQMDETDRDNWNMNEAEALTCDLNANGISASSDEVYEIISAFIVQDKK